jgi:ABC-type phosphate/phosphonate transport system permease subunit
VKKTRPVIRSIGLAIAIIVGVIVYAYGFTVTDVNFETTREESRIKQLTRILRALAHPEVFEYEQETFDVEMPIYLPCPSGGAPEYIPDTSSSYMVLTPPCAGAKEIITIEGFNFESDTRGPINFIPPSGATLTIGNFTTDANGHFQIKVELPNRQPLEEAQALRATARRNVGAPHLSRLALATWDKIVETVFLALLATTFGTLLAIPISFIAAKNLMDEVRSPLSSVALSILGWPIGIFLGIKAVGFIDQLGHFVSQTTLLTLTGAIASPIVIWIILRWAMPQEKIVSPGALLRIGRILGLAIVSVLVVLFLFLLSDLSLSAGNTIVQPLGRFGFLGNFVIQLGDSLRILIPLFAAFAGGSALGGFTGNLGQTASDQLKSSTVKAINLILTPLAGAVLFGLIGAVINWFYQIDDLTKTLWIPGAIGGISGIVLAIRTGPKEPLPIGSTIYYVIRTILNAIRSVEPLVMVIVFVVWVGIGPFAGALALGLHTIAALAKLFSEQVESILPGPLEAVQATGANRLQTIVYAVIPQIVPPYISFTMYRWDINVRMSTEYPPARLQGRQRADAGDSSCRCFDGLHQLHITRTVCVIYK